MKKLLSSYGKRAAQSAVAAHAGHGRALDIKLGFALLRDRRIPLSSKLLSFGIAGVIMSLLIGLEIPFESVLAIFLPALGLAMDVMADGVESVAGSVILCALLMPHLAPRALVETIRAERSGFVPVRTIDVPMPPVSAYQGAAAPREPIQIIR